MVRITSAALIVGLLVLAGCGSGSGDGSNVSGGSFGLPDVPGSTPSLPGVTKGTVRILVTDAPFPYDYVASARVRILEIRVRDASAGEDAGWVTVFDTPTIVDLVPLTGGIAQALVDAQLDPGSYDQVRVVVEPVDVVLTDEASTAIGTRTYSYEDGTLHFPSAQQSGLKVKFEEPLEVVTSLTSDLVLDFDLGRNFVFNGPVDHAPGVKRVIFTPVVRATNVSVNGSVFVRVWSDAGTPDDTSDDGPLSGATVSVRDAGDNEIASGPTAADGTFTASVPAGASYSLMVTATGHDPATTAPMEVVLANLTDFGTVLMQGTLEIKGVVFTDQATADGGADDAVLAGVLVELYEAGGATVIDSTTTDANGAYVFTDVGGGLYDLAFSLAGFSDVLLEDVPGEIQDTGTSRDVTMPALTAVLSGTVTDTSVTPAAPIAGVLVTAVSTLGFDATASGAVSTDTAGTYQIALPTGTYTVTFDDGTTQKTATVVIVGASPPAAVTQDMTFP